MDHLPLPQQRQPFLAPVPYLVKTHRINNDIFEQRIAAAISPVDLLQEAMTNVSDEEIVQNDQDAFFAVIQDWLYFGLMAFVFHSFNPHDFFTNDTDWGRIIVSSKLPTYMAVWEKETASLPKVKASMRIKSIAQAIKLVWKTCDHADHIECGDHISHWLVLFSIRILVTSLGHMVKKFDSKLPLLEAFRLSTTKVHWPKIPNSYRPLVLLMAERGWCFSEIFRMLRTFHCSTVWYMIGLKSHTPLCSDASGCIPDPESSLGCVTRRMRESDYSPQHTNPGCDCDAIHPDMAQVSVILRDGGLPLIRCTVTERTGLELRVVRARRNETHIAISHVYFNGIGIPRQNLIFRCQIQSLFAYMQKAHEKTRQQRIWFFLPRSWHHWRIFRKHTVDFWIDIFCIPWSAQSEQELWSLRSKAISLIEPAFAGAYAILVADTAMRTLDLQDRPLTEISARIAISSWMTRSWTFLEASVMKEQPAFFCVGTELISFNKLVLSKHVKRVHDRASRMIHEDLKWNFLLFSTLWCHEKKLVNDEFNFRTMWNMLADRTTSRPGDEWGILAALLGHSMSEIVSLPEADRPRALFRGLSRLPASFFFKNIQRYQGLEDSRNGWIPKSVDHTIRESEGSLLFADEGIHVGHKIGMTLLLTKKSEPLPESFIVTSTTPSRPSLRISLHDRRAFSNASSIEQEQYCLVLHAFRREEAEFFGAETQGLQGEGACLFVQKSRPDGTIDTEFRSSLTWEMLYEPEAPDYEVSVTGKEILILCDRTAWYEPKFRRQKNLISLPEKAWVVWFALPYCSLLIFPCTLPALIPAMNSQSFKSGAVVVTICVAVLLLWGFLQWLTWRIDDLLFKNWVDSFQDTGTPRKWWRRVLR